MQVAAWALLQLGFLIAAGIAFLTLLIFLLVAGGTLERRDRKRAKELARDLKAPVPQHTLHWRAFTPAGIVRSWQAGLDRVNVDDTAREDGLEPLYEDGNKMDKGFSGGWR